jgi:tRNA threonylcarbamoyladenosine biosynthesis protein TsaE
MTSVTVTTTNEGETEALGARLASWLPTVRLIYIRGALGMGKTTLVRGLLRGLGYDGPVKSPTFTLVESYQMPIGALYHFDLYRLNQPEELEFIGLRDYLSGSSVCIVEWPERASGVLPDPDLDIMMQTDNKQGRTVVLQAFSPAGDAVVRGWR